MISSLLARWVAWVTARPRTVMVAVLAVTAGAAWMSVERFRINSDFSGLIEQDAPWRVDYDNFRVRFPTLVDTGVVVVSGEDVRAVDDAVDRLVSGMSQAFESVYAPSAEPFYRDRALLYMDLDRLDAVAARLIEAQPLLTAVAGDASIRGVLELVTEGVREDPPPGYATLVSRLATSAEAAAGGESGAIDWAGAFLAPPGMVHRLIVFKNPPSFDAALANAASVEAARTIIGDVSVGPDVRVLLTGEIALAHEEIEAGLNGVRQSGWLSLVLLAVVLMFGVRSIKIVAATFSMLAIGVIWTGSWAMLSVGEYNTLSIIFLVMFFGLSIDFAIHFCMRVQESVNRGMSDMASACAASSRSVGPAIVLCTLTTALGFLGFLPTEYAGLADLGLISAGGMTIACVLTFTWLPATFAVFGAGRYHDTDVPTGDSVVAYLVTHRRPVLMVVGLVTVACAAVATQARFDYSVLALRDPDAESMRGLRVMQRERLVNEYSLFAVTQPDAIDRERVLASPLVKELIQPADYVPGDQPDKLWLLDDLQAVLASALYPPPGPPAPGPEALRAEVDALVTAVHLARERGPVMSDLETLSSALEVMDTPALLRWQADVVDTLTNELGWLRRALTVGPVTLEDLPPATLRRLIADTGQRLTVIVPAGDVSNVDELSRFVSGVRALVPNATGRPAVEWGVGRIVLDSFVEALVFAAVSITLVLLAALRSVINTVVVMIPLVLSALITFATGVIFDAPLNMANVLVLPLVFGLGVDNGIHVVERYLGEGDVAHFMHSSTPRAVILSTLTTIGTFASLCLADHQGMASIGWLLTVAIGVLLLCTVLLLPVLLSYVSRNSATF